ncbi:Insulin-degrading enzyme [Arachis hypogaea]|nr:Insulin-degrading enzyme [Arachis hypogaea]
MLAGTLFGARLFAEEGSRSNQGAREQCELRLLCDWVLTPGHGLEPRCSRGAPTAFSILQGDERHDLDSVVDMSSVVNELLQNLVFEYHAIVRMPSTESARICSIGDTGRCKVSTKDDIGTANIVCRHNSSVDKPEEATTVEMNEPVSLTFALRLSLACRWLAVSVSPDLTCPARLLRCSSLAAWLVAQSSPLAVSPLASCHSVPLCLCVSLSRSRLSTLREQVIAMLHLQGLVEVRLRRLFFPCNGISLGCLYPAAYPLDVLESGLRNYLELSERVLTVSGVEKIFDIIGFVYQYLKLLHQIPPQEWIFRELQSIGKMDFRFAEEQRQDDYAAELSENLLFYPPEHVMYGDYVYQTWDEQLIKQLLGFFIPENMRVEVSNVNLSLVHVMLKKTLLKI